MLPELAKLSSVRMPLPAVFDIVMLPELVMVPPALLRMPLPPVFDIVMMPELSKVPPKLRKLLLAEF